MKLSPYASPLLMVVLNVLPKMASSFGMKNAVHASSRLGHSNGFAQKMTRDDDSGCIRRREATQTVFLASLATVAGILGPMEAGAREPLPTYLTEPTEEFKESERQRAEFRRKQLEVKGKFVVVLTRLTAESKTEDQIRTDLEELTALVTATGGLPLGIKKDDMVKVIRSKKAKGFWPTSVEYAYQALIREIAFQQSPNKDKDLGNPL